MLATIINHIKSSLTQRLPIPAFALSAITCQHPQNEQPSRNKQTIKEIFDGLVFVQKRRRSVEERINKKYGNENWQYGQKLFKPKKNIITCMECGNFHEISNICRHCYNKVAEESEKIIQRVRQTWGREVIDQDVSIKYKGEAETADNKRIIEIEDERPSWFASNVLQKSNDHQLTETTRLKEAIDLDIKIKTES